MAFGLIIVLVVYHFGPASGQELYCPCQFQSPDDTDPRCFAKIPLIAGIKDIELNPELEHREQSLTFIQIATSTCDHFSAFVYMETDANTANALALSLKENGTNAVYWIGNASDYTCAYVNETGHAHQHSACEQFNNTRVAYALCEAPPVEYAKESERIEACACPCAFFRDDNLNCFRETYLCLPIYDVDNMISACSGIGTAAAVVATVPNTSMVPSNWPADVLFVIGDMPNSIEEVNKTRCGYNSSRDKFQIKEGLCPSLIEENEKNEVFFWAALCVATEVNVSIVDDCGTEEDELDLDPEDCGAMCSFDQNHVIIITEVFILISVIRNE